MTQSPSDKYFYWNSKAQNEIDKAKKLDNEARKYPINADQYLTIAKLYRKIAKFTRYASMCLSDPNLKTLTLSNYYSMLGNVYKTIGNFFYYSNILERALIFYTRALKQYNEASSYIPLNITRETEHLFYLYEHQIYLEALIFNCKVKIAFDSENWNKALEYLKCSIEKSEQVKTLGGTVAQSVNIEAVIEAAQRDVHYCEAMKFLKRGDVTNALKHAEFSVIAIEKAFQDNPNWGYYLQSLKETISLREGLAFSIYMEKISQDERETQQKILKKSQSLIHNLLSNKFEKEVENYIKREYQYQNTQLNYKPPYLGREIDVCASKGTEKITMTICECKLKLGNQAITSKEVERFAELSRIFHQYEQDKARKEGRQITIRSWFVTNTNLISENAAKIANKYKIKIMQAIIPTDIDTLVSNTNWKISSIIPLH